MQFKNEAAWKEGFEKNTDSYGRGVYTYAKLWANMMEKAMEDGDKLEDVAHDLSNEADIEGITGFMYGCAVSILSDVWKYGEQLRIWHNLKTQFHKEGEEANKKGSVLNPALLNIEFKEDK